MLTLRWVPKLSKSERVVVIMKERRQNEEKRNYPKRFDQPHCKLRETHGSPIHVYFHALMNDFIKC